MTLEDGTELSPARSGSVRSPRRPSSPPGSAPAVDPTASPAAGGPARLWGDGRHRSGDQHRRREPRRHRRGVRLRRRRRRSHRECQAAGASKIIAVDIDDRKLEWARGFGATHTINSTTEDPVERITSSPVRSGSTLPSRPSAGPGVPPVLRGTGPGRDGRAGRRPHPGDDDRAAVPRGVRPRRR
ncbi:MAG: zinc-binding dehydrogenase [Acidimicrobiales bacterium]